jgi:Uma2 family endonuclease
MVKSFKNRCLKENTAQSKPSCDPSEQCVFVYQPDRPTVFYDEPEAKIKVPEFAIGFELTIHQLFSWLVE